MNDSPANSTDLQFDRSFESAVDRNWAPNTACSEGPSGEVFGMIRQALLDGTSVYADIGHNGHMWQSPHLNVRVWDLQHKAGDWMRIGFHEPPNDRYLEWQDFEKLYRLRIGGREWKVRLAQTQVQLTAVYDN